MIPVRHLFEAHLNVSNLERSMAFYGDTLGLDLADVFQERRVAFYWMGGRGSSMLGLWEVGTTPQRQRLHIAFKVDLDDVLHAPQKLRATDLIPCDSDGNPAEEPVVFAWMPAASVFFHDPDGNMLEYLAMLPEPPRRDLGVLSWSKWKAEVRP